MLSNQTDIFHGPRRKTLATQHLEYIAESLLLDPQNVRIIQHSHPVQIQVKNKTFNLSAIIEAKADFQQLHFSGAHLDAYWKFRQDKGLNESDRVSPEFTHLHKAERMAIYEWTLPTRYTSMNFFLRKHFFNCHPKDAVHILLISCIAGSALSKPYAKPVVVNETFRGEKHDQAAIQERTASIAKQQLIHNSGFMAASQKKAGWYYGQQVQVDITQAEKSYNPLGKPIHSLSAFPDEHEVTFAPNTEFHFQAMGQGKFKAVAVRSVNADHGVAYKHGFNDIELMEIELDHARVHSHPVAPYHSLPSSVYAITPVLTPLITHLKAEKIVLKHNFVRRLFDTVNNHRKQAYLQTAITALENLANGEKTLESTQTALTALEQALAGHTALVHAALFRSKPGKTHAALSYALDQMKAMHFTQTENAKKTSKLSFNSAVNIDGHNPANLAINAADLEPSGTMHTPHKY